MGNIEAEIYLDKAPKTATAFLEYVDKGIYNNSSFYRVLLEESMSSNENNGLIQGGTWPNENEQFAFVKPIPHESTQQTGLTHTDGTLSLARLEVGTGSTEFFICIGNQTHFDYGRSTPADGQGMACFGMVTSGMSIVREIQKQPASGDNFVNKITILKIIRL